MVNMQGRIYLLPLGHDDYLVVFIASAQPRVGAHPVARISGVEHFITKNCGLTRDQMGNLRLGAGVNVQITTQTYASYFSS
jgi:hypothetical protein